MSNCRRSEEMAAVRGGETPVIGGRHHEERLAKSVVFFVKNIFRSGASAAGHHEMAASHKHKRAGEPIIGLEEITWRLSVYRIMSAAENESERKR